MRPKNPYYQAATIKIGVHSCTQLEDQQAVILIDIMLDNHVSHGIVLRGMQLQYGTIKTSLSGVFSVRKIQGILQNS